MARIDAILKLVKDQGASDLHMTTGSPPMVRIHGEITPVPHPEITREMNEGLLFEIMDPDLRARYDADKGVDFSYEVPGVVRVRCNVYEQTRGVAGAFRILPNQILPLDQLGLPAHVTRLTELSRGLVLVTGPPGSGKSSTLAAMMDHINRSRRKQQARLMLAESLKGVLAQRLLRRKDGHGRALALEILVGNSAVASLIREKKTFQLSSVIQTGRKDGMQSMDESVLALVKTGAVSHDAAAVHLSSRELLPNPERGAPPNRMAA